MKWIIGFLVTVVFAVGTVGHCLADLAEIKASGQLRHLGVPYANFVTGDGEGLDAAILKMFAKEIGVKYVYVKTDWDNVIGDLSGKKIKPEGDDVKVIGETPVKGDIIGNGLTIIPWRQKVIDFSDPYFPTAIWVLAVADSPLQPIRPSGDLKQDIKATEQLLKDKNVLSIKNTCVDLSLYNVPGACPLYKDNISLNDLAGVLVKGAAEVTILDVPDTLVALVKFPGQIKVLGTITEAQFMGFGFPKDSPELRSSFNEFLGKIKKSGQLGSLIREYYPAMKHYFPDAVK